MNLGEFGEFQDVPSAALCAYEHDLQLPVRGWQHHPVSMSILLVNE